MRVLTRTDIEQLLTASEAIDVIRRLFEEIGSGGVDLQLRTSMTLHDGRDTVLFMPGYLASTNRLGLKLVSVFPDNPARNGRSTISATIVLNDARTGELAAVLDGGAITAIRTGAVSAVATDILAVKRAHRLAIFGAGVQARSHILAMQQVRPLTDVRVYDVDATRASALVDRLERDGKCRCPIEVVGSPAAAVHDADVIVTATTSRTPVFDGRCVKSGAHINAIGAFQPDRRELDDDIMRRARIFVDSRTEALAEAGDLIIPLSDGVIPPEAIEGTLGDLMVRRQSGRRDESEITVFKAVGLAVEDIAVASYILDKAALRQVGTIVERDET